MGRFVVLVGLLRSGKSTYSVTLRENGFAVAECDAVRKAVGTYPFVAEREPEVWRHMQVMVEALVHAGNDVVVDSVNHTRERRRMWQKFSPKYFVIRTPVDVCVNKARLTDQEYLVPVILKMAEEWEEVKEDEGLVLQPFDKIAQASEFFAVADKQEHYRTEAVEAWKHVGREDCNRTDL